MPRETVVSAMSDTQLDLFGNPQAIDVGAPPACALSAGTLLEQSRIEIARNFA